MDKLSRHLDLFRLAVIMVIYGVLLALLAVQLTADGLAETGVIS
jgi:small neutral amino acid transporter SnatA (MarC family)